MRKVLFLDACVRPESRTRRLGQHILSRLEGQVETLDLASLGLEPLSLPRLRRRDALIAAGRYDDPMFRLARQYREADELVIAAPCWDMSFPAVLKLYFESVMVLGLTFSYTAEGLPMGLCQARRLLYAVTAGGSLEGQNLGFEYVRTLTRTYHGIREAHCFSADNLDVIGVDPEAVLARACAEIDRVLSV